ncbi:MAG TPA: PA domain-containing protein [Ideonella sp.]|uniref:PA domain-containing protein n=1 Tax=Ideonella sp. TaxID=1929293 RepID=UPI002BD156B9|nr:PA domain-containing protein [Ideonella sp.]HSI51309.1 PA domain-containing protein [Ideonella sp.]
MSGIRMHSRSLVALVASLAAFTAWGATIEILNTDSPGVGFNDKTAAAPVGGNEGSTLGEQRMNVYKKVASVWGQQLPEGPVIQISANWPALDCNSSQAVLGQAGAVTSWHDFPNAPKTGTWYPAALANTLAQVDLDDGAKPEISSSFNVNLGKANCLEGTPWYLGLDGNAPAGSIDFAVVLTHEVGHGLGFATPTNGSTGLQPRDTDGKRYPTVWESMMFDNTAGKTWLEMTAAERRTSAINPRGLVWTGPKVVADMPSVLKKGTPMLTVKSKKFPDVAGVYLVGPAEFGPPLSGTALKGGMARVIDQADGATGLACDPLSSANASLVAGKVALLDRGTCNFSVKVKNAQDAGAIGVIVVNNVAGGPPGSLPGSDDTVVIPSVMITQADGATLKTVLTGSLLSTDKITAVMGIDKTRYAGADAAGRVMLFTPNPFQGGSSVSHWDTSASRNLLMEPAINDDLPTFKVSAPKDLTLELLKDIGW